MAIKKRNKVSAEFSMSSLTDIIFLLLIFFMLTSTLVKQNALNLKLPKSSSETIAPQSMGVSIEKGGKFYLDGKRMSFTNLEKAVRSKIRGYSNPSNTSLTIYAEENAEVKHVAKVMDLALRLNVTGVLATQPE